jgi:hypothetical protein
MWIGGDGIMFVLMMLVFLMWSRDERAAVSGHGFFERARQANLATLVSSHHPAMPGAGMAATPEAAAGQLADSSRGGIDDDEHLAAYNAYLARLNQHPSRRAPG